MNYFIVGIIGLYINLSQKRELSILGHNTQWCTTGGPYSTNKSYVDRKNHFSHHNDRGGALCYNQKK